MTAFRALCAVVVGAVVFAAAPAALAQTWPARSIQTISTVSAGNAGDIVARIILDQVSKQIGQAFVLENRPGAGGTLASTYVAKADPAGHTVLLLTSSQASYVVMHKNLAYDPIRDFVPVASLVRAPAYLYVPANAPFTSVASLIAAALTSIAVPCRAQSDRAPLRFDFGSGTVAPGFSFFHGTPDAGARPIRLAAVRIVRSRPVNRVDLDEANRTAEAPGKLPAGPAGGTTSPPCHRIRDGIADNCRDRT
jgi:hypothetical protein